MDKLIWNDMKRKMCPRLDYVFEFCYSISFSPDINAMCILNDVEWYNDLF